MKNSFQETKKSKFPLLWNHPSVCFGRSDNDLAIRKLIPLFYPGFIGFFSLSPTLPSNFIPSAKRSGRWDYLMIWGLLLMFNLLYDSFLGLLFLGLSFGM